MNKTIPSLMLVVVSRSMLMAADTFTYVDLLKRLTDLEALCVLPEPGEKCEQWSSYDRASKYNETTGK